MAADELNVRDSPEGLAKQSARGIAFAHSWLTESDLEGWTPQEEGEYLNEAYSEMNSEGKLSWESVNKLLVIAKMRGGGAMGCSCGCGEDAGWREWLKSGDLVKNGDIGNFTDAGKKLVDDLASLAEAGDFSAALTLWIDCGGDRPWLAAAGSLVQDRAIFAGREMDDSEKIRLIRAGLRLILAGSAT